MGAFFGFDESGLQPTEIADTSPVRARQSRDPHFSTSDAPPPKDFLFQKTPTTDVERVACLAYYLTHHRDTSHFTTIDISKLNTEAAQVKFSNPSAAVNNATRAGLLTTATRGMKQLTAHGERYVEALPDRAAAKQLMSRVRPRRPRKKSGGNGPANAASPRSEMIE